MKGLSPDDLVIIALGVILASVLLYAFIRMLLYDFDEVSLEQDTETGLTQPLRDPPWTPEEAERAFDPQGVYDHALIEAGRRARAD